MAEPNRFDRHLRPRINGHAGDEYPGSEGG
jgi:hypothetical protein